MSRLPSTRRALWPIGVALLTAGTVAAACARDTPASPSTLRASDPSLHWGPAPSVFAPGAQFAVVAGDPSQAGVPFTVMLRFPNGYKVMPHTHPTDEKVTVLDGTFRVGMGTTFDESALTTVPTGGSVTAPAEHAHYAQAQGVTTVQVDAIGPFALTYVNPDDAPRPRGAP